VIDPENNIELRIRNSIFSCEIPRKKIKKTIENGRIVYRDSFREKDMITTDTMPINNKFSNSLSTKIQSFKFLKSSRNIKNNTSSFNNPLKKINSIFESKRNLNYENKEIKIIEKEGMIIFIKLKKKEK
jgi:transposase-like protein